MSLTLTDKVSEGSRPIHLVTKESFAALDLGASAKAWAQANAFTGKAGQLLILPGEDGEIAGAVFGVADKRSAYSPLATGTLARQLPAGAWHIEGDIEDADLAALGLLLGSYSFTRYRKGDDKQIEFAAPNGANGDSVRSQAEAAFLVRDLINTPTNDLGPDDLEAAARALAEKHGAKINVIVGDALIEQNFPMIHAVGRASAQAPRLIDFSWGKDEAPKVTLVGKGVCFDTGGLDIKPSSSMLLMKKDMGGAANVLGLASMLMAANANIRLRVLIPAVENSISANAFRPGDVLQSRKGLTVEIGNTDAEGRLILADALALADEEKPEILIDMATLTGAARVALGPDLPPFFTDDDALAGELSAASHTVADPLWRLPLWSNYDSKLASKVADLNNVTTDGMAGAVTAALFLRRFVENTPGWAHFDVFGWSPVDRPHCPIGGEAQAIRAILHVITQRYGVA